MTHVSSDIFENPVNTREEILAATYRTLRDRGYADLTMQAIGEELDQSPSLVYHHYEDKDALVLACLEYLLEHFRDEYSYETIDDPRERLEEVVDWCFGTADADDDRQPFVRTVLELRVQAIHDPAYRAHFTRSDQVFAETIAAIIRAGIDTGDFRECDPNAVAETLQTVFFGMISRLFSTDADGWAEAVSNEVELYLDSRVYAT